MRDIVLGGGCFWCTEAIFERVTGVEDVTVGYAGGHVDDPSYDEVCSGGTGHVECAKVTFDEDVISLRKVLEIHLDTINPFRGDGQGPDSGDQYAPAIFYKGRDEKEVVEDTVQSFEEAEGKEMTMRIEELDSFFAAEEYHQDYYEKNPYHPYCVINIRPKLNKYFD